ncbi:hypothetical protein QTP88_024968 [Uroleucon formosanum]
MHNILTFNIQMTKITSLLVIFVVSHTNSMDYTFPNDFMFGTATAAYQIEGGWNEDGKGENIWDHLVHTRPELIKDRTNGDISCDSYHKYKEDVALAKNLNVKFYRFSISWARIAPSGVMNKLNQKGIAYYNHLIDELIKNNIMPVVTMYHWDLPQYLQDLGGWVNPIMSDYFKEYARVLFTYYGDRVKWWITINEPLEVSTGYAFKAMAPYLRLNNTGYYLAGHTQLIAHGKAYRLYEEMFKSTQQGTADFYAFNHYSSRLVTQESSPDSYYNSIANYYASVDESWPKASPAPWLITAPIGLKKLLVWIKNEYGNPPMFITENGFGDNGQLDDLDRISYIKGYLNATLQAIHEDNCNVIGYTLWSLLDNFEWMDGFAIHFGLVKVDFNDPERTRTPKASYTFFKNVITTGRLITNSFSKKTEF